MIPPQIMQQFQQSAQKFIASHQATIHKAIHYGLHHLGQHWDDYKKELDDWLKKNF